jgi:hypothetical protein
MLFSEPRQAEVSWVSSPLRLAITLPYDYETRFSMFRILKQSFRTGVVTEAPPEHDDAELERLGIEVRPRSFEGIARSGLVQAVLRILDDALQRRDTTQFSSISSS